MMMMIRMLSGGALAAALTWGAGVKADGNRECARYSTTPLGSQVDLLTGPMPTFETGQYLPSFGAFAVKLRPAKRIIYPYKSANDHDAAMGAVLAIEFVPAGPLRISLSAPALLDVVQEDQLLTQKTVEIAGDCPGIALAVEVQSAGGPLVLQISGADVELLNLLVFPQVARGTGADDGIRAVSAP